jgi:hypothetical protein
MVFLSVGLVLLATVDWAVTSFRVKRAPRPLNDRRFDWAWAGMGGATVPVPEPLVPTGPCVQGSVLVVQRPWQFRDVARRYSVVVDGVQVGRLWAMQTVRVRLEPGVHTVQVRIDMTGSPVYEARIAEGSVTRCQVHKPEGPFGTGPGEWLRISQE